MPEVKTLRRKLSRLAARKGSHALGREIAQRRIENMAEWLASFTSMVMCAPIMANTRFQSLCHSSATGRPRYHRLLGER